MLRRIIFIFIPLISFAQIRVEEGNGLYHKRTIEGTENEINVSNGTGIDDDITLSLSDTLYLPGEIQYSDTYWDDVLVDGSIFSFPGAADPAPVSCNIGGSGLTLELYEFAINDEAYFTVQVPHNVKLNTDLKVHVHWYNGTRGNEESTNKVGWKVIWQLANINSAFAGTYYTSDLSDANIATDYTHNISPETTQDVGTLNISCYIVGKVTRTDTGTDDTWATNTTGNLPLLLGVDFHYEIDTPGSRESTSK